MNSLDNMSKTTLLQNSVKTDHGRIWGCKFPLSCLVILTILALSSGAQLCYSQGSVHVQGQKMIDLQYGFTTKSSRAIQSNFTTTLNRAQSLRFGLTYEKGVIGSFEFDEVRLSNRFSHVIVNVNDRLFIGGIGGIQLGYNSNKSWIGENLDEGPTKESYLEQKGHYLYGVSLGLEIEYFIFNRVAVIAECSEHFSFNSAFGRFHLIGTGGLRYAF